jgi:transposase
MRHRSEMVGDSAKQLQLMQKSLTEMNLKLQHVFSDIDGFSAQAIIDAILAGERDPAILAALRDKRCRSTAEDIIEALRGDYREEYLFVLRQSQQTYRQLREAIARCDEKLGRTRRPCGMRSEWQHAPGPQEPSRRRQKQPAIRHL